MIKIFSTVFVALLTVSCISGNTDLLGRKRVTAQGPYVTRPTKYVDNFNEIDSRGIADVEYTQTEGKPSITISGAENILQYLIVEVNGNVLEIYIEKGINIQGESRLKVKVTGNELVKINTSGTGDITLMGNLSTDRLEVRTSGTGDMEFRDITSSGDVEIRTSGTGDVELGELVVSNNDVTIHTSGTGNVEFENIIASGNNVTIDTSGTGDVNGHSIQCAVSKINSSGSADVEIEDFQGEDLDLRVSGTGDATLRGNTVDFSATVSGTGDVSARGLIADKVTARASGTGSISCHAVHELYASASGIGSIVYSGNPEIVEISGRKGGVRRSND